MRRHPATLLTLGLCAGLGACQVQVEDPGEMPDVDVEGGRLPEYEVDGPDVRVGVDTVVVPDVDVNPPGDPPQ